MLWRAQHVPETKGNSSWLHRNRQGLVTPSLGGWQPDEGPHPDPTQHPKLIPGGHLATSGVKCSSCYTVIPPECPPLLTPGSKFHPSSWAKQSPSAGCPESGLVSLTRRAGSPKTSCRVYTSGLPQPLITMPDSTPGGGGVARPRALTSSTLGAAPACRSRN